MRLSLVTCNVPGGGYSEWHIKGDVLEVLNGGSFITESGELMFVGEWDLVIAHPPCTRLCNSGVCWLEKRNLWKELFQAARFFNEFVKWHKKTGKPLVIENPIPHGYAQDLIGKYTQVIQPWMFGHGETKATCLWLYGLPELKPTDIVDGREQRLHRLPPSKDRAKLRSKTYPGIAEAIAKQYSEYLTQQG